MNVLTPARVVTVGTQVVVGALRASKAVPSLDLQLAGVAGAGKGGSVGVMQVVQHHGAAVLGAPDGVELVVVALTQRKESLQTHGMACLHKGLCIVHRVIDAKK